MKLVVNGGFQMKNVLLCGTAKSGKTYLAKKINKNGHYNHIPIDYFTSSFKHNFPEVGISSNVVIERESSKKLSLFLSRIIEIMDQTEEEFYILDSAHLYPSDVIKYIDREKWDVYFLGYPNTTVEEKFLQLRKYVQDGWPSKKSDEELKEMIEKLIQVSKTIEEECAQLHIPFIDASKFENLEKI